MEQLPNSITITVAILTLFLGFITVLKYAIDNTFVRARLIMTSFFFFIIATLSISFWNYTLLTLPFTIPAGFLGVLVGYFMGVRAAKERMHTEGLRQYMEHFAHIHVDELKSLTWWSVINFYTIASALVLINLVGLSTVLYRGNAILAICTSIVGAFLIGTIVPYLVHLWSISAAQKKSTTTKDSRNI